jgi:predicted RNase H-like HicB family nuclease
MADAGAVQSHLTRSLINDDSELHPVLEKEGDMYVSLCPELDVASQGATVEEATANLKETVELFLESADAEEVKRRLHTEVFVTRFEVEHG